MSLATVIGKTGLLSVAEAYTFIIPPLSCANQLPVEVIVDSVLENAKLHEVNLHWREAADIYIHLIQLTKNLPDEDLFVMKAFAAAVEFYQSLWYIGTCLP